MRPGARPRPSRCRQARACPRRSSRPKHGPRYWRAGHTGWPCRRAPRRAAPARSRAPRAGSLALHGVQHVEEALEDGEIGRGADGARSAGSRRARPPPGARRFSSGAAAQGGASSRPGFGCARGRATWRGIRPPARWPCSRRGSRCSPRGRAGRRRRWVGGAVDLGQGHEHRRLDRAEPAARLRPLAERLEFQRMGRDIGHVEALQRLDGRMAVVVGGAAHEAEAGERDHRIDGRAQLVVEIGVDRRAPVEPAREGRKDGDALPLESLDHRVVMGGVGGEDVGAQHQEAHRDLGAAGRGRSFGSVVMRSGRLG